MRLAVDANVLLAASLGGRTRRVFSRPDWSFFTTGSVMAEVSEHAPIIASRRGLALPDVETAFRSIPVNVVPDPDFAHCLSEAWNRIGGRDPDDVALLALALAMRIPLWSNDKDFAIAGIELWTTAAIMESEVLWEPPAPPQEG